MVAEFVDNDCLDQVPPAAGLTGADARKMDGGAPTVGYDRDTVWMTYATFDRHYRWAGLRMGRDGNRIAVARGNVIVPLDQRTPPFWRFNRQQNQMLLSSFHMSKANLPAYFDAKRFGAEGSTGFVNGILDRILQEKAAGLKKSN